MIRRALLALALLCAAALPAFADGLSYPFGSGGTGGSGCIPVGSGQVLQSTGAGTCGGITGATSNGTTITFTNSDLLLAGSSTGVTTFTSANAGVSNFTLTFPAITDTIVTLTATQTLTSKTLTSPTLTSPTVTGAFTATGLVTNADLVNQSTTVAGQTCTLGSSCSIAIGNLSAIAADNLVGNPTAGSASPAVMALLSCSTGTSALTYNTTSHAFGCNSISGGGLTVGTTTIASGTAGGLLFDSGPGTLQENAAITVNSQIALVLNPTAVAAPTAVTERFAPSVATGNLNTAGVSTTIQGSGSTGSGAAGALIFQITPKAGSASTPNTQVTALSLNDVTSNAFSSCCTGSIEYDFQNSNEIQAASQGMAFANGNTLNTIFKSDGTLWVSHGLSLCNSTACGGANVILNQATPTISSGFGTSPAVTGTGGTAGFQVNVGTGGTATSGVIAMGATAANGWACSTNDITTASTSVFLTKETASTTTTVTIGNFNTAGAATAWVASDKVAMSCWGF